MTRNSDRITKLAGCRIVDVIKGTVVSGVSDVYLRDGKICAVRREGEDAPEPDCLIDINGGYVMPGMINTHCHIGHITPALLADMKTLRLTKKWQDTQINHSLQQCLAYGITTIRDALSDNLVKIGTLSESIRNGDICGPSILPSVLISHGKGACVQPSSGIGKLLLRILGIPVLDYADSGTGVVLLQPDPTEEDLETAVAEALRRGGAYIKFYDQHEKMLTYKPGAEVLSGNELKAIAACCHERNLYSLMHHFTAGAFTAGVAAGIHTLTHLPMDRLLTEGEVEEFRMSQASLEPTLSLAYHYCWKHPGLTSVNGRLAELTEERSSGYRTLIDKYWISQLRDSVAKNFERASAGTFRSFGGLNMLPFFRYMDSFTSTGFDNLLLLLKAGCHDRICFGNDAGATQTSPAEKDTEIDLIRTCCTRAAMSASDTNAFIVRMLTCNGARALGLGNELGQVREGFRADLAVCAENPLDDTEVLKKPVTMTVAGGMVYSVNKNAEVKLLWQVT